MLMCQDSLLCTISIILQFQNSEVGVGVSIALTCTVFVSVREHWNDKNERGFLLEWIMLACTSR